MISPYSEEVLLIIFVESDQIYISVPINNKIKPKLIPNPGQDQCKLSGSVGAYWSITAR